MKTPNRFKIDENKLDREWIDQPTLFYRSARRLAKARKDHEDAKALLALTEAELARDIRRDPEMFGLPAKAPANDIVEKTTLLQSEYTVARDSVILAKYKVDILQAAVDTLEHKKRALENLVHLLAINFRSEPVAPKAARDYTEKAERKEAFGGGKKPKSSTREK